MQVLSFVQASFCFENDYMWRTFTDFEVVELIVFLAEGNRCGARKIAEDSLAWTACLVSFRLPARDGPAHRIRYGPPCVF